MDMFGGLVYVEYADYYLLGYEITHLGDFAFGHCIHKALGMFF